MFLMDLGNAGDALPAVGCPEVHQQDNSCCLLRGLGILWAGIQEDGARVASGLGGCLPSEHPCTRVILTRLVPKFAVAVDFLI